ncbi:MAG TPA: hypothetical protein VLC91_16250 [Spongiibacteraceae bacterium]|nr:hypothetical protein [Spongiibacteraceae bacterium]
MNEPDDEELAQSVLVEAIENQIRDGNPAEAKNTLNKLMLVGTAREEAVQMMATVLAVEVRSILKEERAFDTAWYVKALQALPTLPDEK